MCQHTSFVTGRQLSLWKCGLSLEEHTHEQHHWHEIEVTNYQSLETVYSKYTEFSQ